MENNSYKNDMQYENINLIPSDFENELESNSGRNENYDATACAYSLSLNVYANILDCNLSEREKLFKIIIVLLKNIIDSPNDEKFKKLKLSNKNIQNLFETQGVYDLAKFLGFEEEYEKDENELNLVLRDNYSMEYIQLVFSFLNLLVSDNEEENSMERNPSEDLQTEKRFEYPNLSELNSANNFTIQNSNHSNNIVDILRQTSGIRHNTGLNSNNNNEQYSNRKGNNKNKDIKSILKETAAIRQSNSQNRNMVNNYNYTQYPLLEHDSCGYGCGNNSNNNYNRKDSNQITNKKFATLSDFKFSNPELNQIYRRDYKIIEEIGKKCLQLTNEFRRQNRLSPVEWNDDIWRISFEHSYNMGLKRVKFGHDGFNNRIEKLPFYYSLACENVFMCNGYSEYNLAELSVNGWINSPGHRKNLLSHSTHCAIAVYRNGYGEYFLTQIFVRK